MSADLETLPAARLTVTDGRVHRSPGDREHRQHVRHSCIRWVGLVTVDDDGAKSPVITARAEDISAGGLGLYSWENVEGRGAILIPRADGKPAVVGAEIVYCRHRSRLDYDCGVRFTGPARDVSIDDFRDNDGEIVDLGPASASEEPLMTTICTSPVERAIDAALGREVDARDVEHRKFQRHAQRSRVALLPVDRVGRNGVRLIVHTGDVSAAGFSARGRRPVEPGSACAVMLPREHGASALVGAVVVRCAPDRVGGWDLGLQFRDSPPSASTEDFRDADGRLPLLGPAVAE